MKKNYYTEKETICYNLLNWIEESNKVSKEYNEYLKYDSKESANNFFTNSNVKFCANGLYIDNSNDLYTRIFYQIEKIDSDIIDFKHCLNLQYCIIKDINKLVKKVALMMD